MDALPDAILVRCFGGIDLPVSMSLVSHSRQFAFQFVALL